MSTIVAAAGGGNWTTGASWVGGVAPTAADDAQLTAASGNITIDSGSVCRSLDCTTYTGTLTHGGVALTIGDGTAGAGNVALGLVAGMTYTLSSVNTSSIAFISTSTTQQTIDFAGKSTGPVSWTGSGGSWILSSAWTSSSTNTASSHTRGVLNTNGQTIVVYGFNSNSGLTRTLTLGASAFTVNGAGFSSWNVSATALTLTANTATITISGAGSSFAGGTGLTYGGTLNLTGSGTMTFNSGDVANVTRTGTAIKTDVLALGANMTCSGTFTSNGNSVVNRVLVRSDTLGTARTITAATVTVTNSDFRDITGAGAGSWNLAAITGNSGDCGGNSGITFTTAATQTSTGTASFTWSTHGWTTRAPLPQDDVFVSNAFVAGRTVTMDMPRMGKSIDWTGATGTPTWGMNGTSTTIYGSITLIPGMIYTGGAVTVTLEGRGAHTITSAGLGITNDMSINALGGSYTLSDAFSLTGKTLTINNGSFITNNFSVDFAIFNSSNANTRIINFGSSTLTTTFTASLGTVFSLDTTTNLTFTGSASTIIIAGANTNTRTFAGGGLTYGTLRYTLAGSTGQLNITKANTFDKIEFSDTTNARTLAFTAATTTTFTGAGIVGSGASGRLLILSGITAATYTLTKASGTVSIDWWNITNALGSDGSTWYAGANSTDSGGNTRFVFTDVPVTTTDVTGHRRQAQIRVLQAKAGSSPGLRRLSDLRRVVYGGRGGAYDELQYLRNRNADAQNVNEKESDAWTKFGPANGAPGTRADQIQHDFEKNGTYP